MENSKIYKESISKLLIETDNIVFEIRSLRRDNQKATADNDNKINLLQEELLKVESLMQKTLAESGEEAIKPKCAQPHFKAMKDKIIYTDKTIDEIETKYPTEADTYIKTSKSLKLDPLKRDIEAGDIILKEMTREPQPKKFDYKYTGE